MLTAPPRFLDVVERRAIERRAPLIASALLIPCFRQKSSHLSDARHLRLGTGSPRRTGRVCGRTCDPSPADPLSQRRAQERVVVSYRPRRQAAPDESAVVAVEPRGSELPEVDRTEVGLRLLREQFVAEEGLRGETAGVRVIEEGVQQMPDRSLGRASRAVCHLGQQLGGRLVRRPFRPPDRPADLAVVAGVRVTAGGGGDLPNAWGALAYPGHAQTPSAFMGWIMGWGWRQIVKPQLGGMAERTNATVLKTVG